MMTNEFNTLQSFDADSGRESLLHSLPALEKQGIGPISRLPVSIRIVLESVLRNCDGKKVRRKDVETLANWKAKSPANEEIPFVVARIVLQDFTGVPLVVDLAAMRSAVQRLGGDPRIIEPLVPVDLVVDHSVQVDFAGSAVALRLNMEMEFKRNRERYEFLKWGQQAFKTFGLVPPGIGIVHQVNLEYLAKGVLSTPSTINHQPSTLFYPDTLVGTDSHTTMINGLGVVGWGVGGIEAEAGMLGQPVYFLTPEVVGVHMTGSLGEGVTATDLALHITQMLRKSRRQVCRVLRRRCRVAATAGPRNDRQHVARIWRDDGLFPGRRRVGELLAGDRPQRRAMPRVRRLFSRAENVRYAAPRRDRLQRRSRTRPARCATERGWPEAAAGSNQFAGAREHVSIVARETGQRRRLREVEWRSRASAFR